MYGVHSPVTTYASMACFVVACVAKRSGVWKSDVDGNIVLMLPENDRDASDDGPDL